MGLFSKKDKDDGWDEDAALEFHNKAPAAKISEIPPSKVGNLYRQSSAPEPLPPGQEAAQPQQVASSLEEAPQTQPEAEAQVQPEPAGQNDAQSPEEPESQSVVTNETQETPGDKNSEDELVLDSSYEAKDQENDPAAYVSRILFLVEHLKAEVNRYKDEKLRLEQELRTLKEEIDAQELNAPEFENTIRGMVDDLNYEITKEYVAGVEAVELPEFESVSELSDIIAKVADSYTVMVPALEKSRDSAQGMLDTLVPESSMYIQTKDLLEFSLGSIQKIEEFLAKLDGLRGNLEKALSSSDSVLGTYEQKRAESESNLEKIIALAEVIHKITDEFQQLGSDLEENSWSSLD